MAPSLTRELVIATARRHLEADGLGRFSLRAVARDLEVTAPALYAYVSSKEELVALVAAAHFEALARRFEEVGDDDPLDRSRDLDRVGLGRANEQVRGGEGGAADRGERDEQPEPDGQDPERDERADPARGVAAGRGGRPPGVRRRGDRRAVVSGNGGAAGEVDAGHDSASR